MICHAIALALLATQAFGAPAPNPPPHVGNGHYDIASLLPQFNVPAHFSPFGTAFAGLGSFSGLDVFPGHGGSHNIHFPDVLNHHLGGKASHPVIPVVSPFVPNPTVPIEVPAVPATPTVVEPATIVVEQPVVADPIATVVDPSGPTVVGPNAAVAPTSA